MQFKAQEREQEHIFQSNQLVVQFKAQEQKQEHIFQFNQLQ